MGWRARALLGALFVLVLIGGPALAQQDFYKGKTVRIIVPLAAGGTYDIMSRLVAQHIGKHLSGNPSVIVENRPGGAYLIGARAAYNAPADGLTLFHFPSTAVYGQLLGEVNDVDFGKFEWLGSAGGAYYVLVARSALPIQSLDDLKKAKDPLNVGVLSPDSVISATAKLARDMAGLNLKLITGYNGANDIELAARRSELDGYTTADVTFLSSAVTLEMLESKFIRPIAVFGGSQPHPKFAAELEKLPKIRDLVAPGLDQQAYDAFIGTFKITRPFVVTPGTPADRVAMLRKALEATLREPDFLAAAEKGGFVLEPIGGAETGKLLGSIFNMQPAVKDRVSALLK
jgi:tripartite-type tricarboxylate transporter receptor subunit TctC